MSNPITMAEAREMASNPNLDREITHIINSLADQLDAANAAYLQNDKYLIDALNEVRAERDAAISRCDREKSGYIAAAVERDALHERCEALEKERDEATDAMIHKLTVEVYDVLYAGEPAGEREPRWKWVMARVHEWAKERDQLRERCEALERERDALKVQASVVGKIKDVVIGQREALREQVQQAKTWGKQLRQAPSEVDQHYGNTLLLMLPELPALDHAPLEPDKAERVTDNTTRGWRE